MLRKHQKQLADRILEIFDGREETDILVHATPGAGKSALPIIMTRLIDAGMADALCWVVPRVSLRYQAEQNFTDLFLRKLIMHKHTIRAAMNDYMPCRGHSGIVTTYQAMASVNDKILDDFKRKKYILVLDEFHHLDKNGEWHKSIDPLYQAAKYRLLMTGTIERGDKKEIAYLPYRRFWQTEKTEVLSPDMTDAIIYSRRDALAEKAILPIEFHLHDGEAKWKDLENNRIMKGKISTIPREYFGAIIQTALTTRFANQLLEAGLTDWANYRKEVTDTAKALIIAANIKAARDVQQKLRAFGLSADIATSDDSKAAHVAIRKFKTGNKDLLIGVGMFYEGFDCKQVSHIICLTNIRSTPWIEQMIARAVRIDPAVPYERQMAHIFAPDDVLFRGIMQKIVAEQNEFITKKIRTRQAELFDSDGEREQKIIPIDSRMSGGRTFKLDHDLFDIDYSQGPSMTPSDHEAIIRQEVDRLAKRLAGARGVHPRRINLDIMHKFGLSRKDMDYNQLLKVKLYLKDKIKSLNGRRPARRITVRPWSG